tara:strand:- start:465 stop:674 length:210 start_codon:yes stop_codon:yes gene_type:complete
MIEIELEDLKEIRNLLDKFILKYQEKEDFRSEHDSRLKKDNKPLTSGMVGYPTIRKSGMEGCAVGNDYY